MELSHKIRMAKKSRIFNSRLTAPEIFEVGELIIPLCDYSDSIFEESNDDQKSSDRRQISVMWLLISTSSFLFASILAVATLLSSLLRSGVILRAQVGLTVSMARPMR